MLVHRLNFIVKCYMLLLGNALFYTALTSFMFLRVITVTYE